MQIEIDTTELVAAIGDAIIVSDSKGLITLWNPAAERIFGFSETEALGKSLDLITPERYQQRHWDGFHETMRTGKTRYAFDVLRVPAVHKDGRALSIAFTVAMISSGIVAVIRDETQRWSEERDLRKRLAHLEAFVTEHDANKHAS
jgi:PAS domain S-box-containing protein